MRHLGAVGTYSRVGEPTAEHLGANMRHLGAVGLGTYSRVGANMRHLGAVGWEPTAELGPT